MSVRLPFAPSDSMWHVVIDTLTMYSDARSMVVRLLAEIDAAN